MHLITNPASLLAVVLSLLELSFSLPHVRKTHTLEALIRRAPYEIIPVDGGISSNGNDDNIPSPNEHTTFTTIAVSATRISTKTETLTLPETTDYVTSTKFVMGPTITQTTQITVTPPASPTTIIMTSYSTVDILPTYSSGGPETYNTTLPNPLDSSTISPTSTICCDTKTSTLASDTGHSTSLNYYSSSIQSIRPSINSSGSDIVSTATAIIPSNSRNSTQPIPTNPPYIVSQQKFERHLVM